MDPNVREKDAGQLRWGRMKGKIEKLKK